MVDKFNCKDCEAPESCGECPRERSRFTMPLTGDLVECDCCYKEYRYFIWAMGSDRFLCKACVASRPSAYLDNIDAAEAKMEREEELMYDEIEERTRRENGPRPGHKSERKKRKKWQN